MCCSIWKIKLNFRIALRLLNGNAVACASSTVRSRLANEFKLEAHRWGREGEHICGACARVLRCVFERNAVAVECADGEVRVS